jgi:hypothetical protein
MPYQNDVFISYRREKNAWTPCARDTFKLALESCLQRELGDPPNIFIDDQTPVGINFVNHLASALATSKIMIALLSKDYFSSDWCIHELDLMMEKAQGADIIIPIVVHDGDAIPDAVSLLQSADFRSYAIPALCHAGPLHAEFWTSLVRLSKRIGNAVETTPDFDSRWEPAFRQRLTDVYAALNAGRRSLPKHFTLKATVPLKIPPPHECLGGRHDYPLPIGLNRHLLFLERRRRSDNGAGKHCGATRANGQHGTSGGLGPRGARLGPLLYPFAPEQCCPN